MGLDQTDIKRMISCAADRMAEKTGYLGDIDSHFGDGDHGLTIGRIAALMKERAAAWDEGDIAGFLDDLGTGIMEIREDQPVRCTERWSPGSGLISERMRPIWIRKQSGGCSQAV